MSQEYTPSAEYVRQFLFVPKCDVQFVISDQLCLDVLLVKIRPKTIAYATMKKRVNEKKRFRKQYSVFGLFVY